MLYIYVIIIPIIIVLYAYICEVVYVYECVYTCVNCITFARVFTSVYEVYYIHIL